MQAAGGPAQLQRKLAAIAVPREYPLGVGVHALRTHGAQLGITFGPFLAAGLCRLDQHVRIPRQQLLQRDRPQAAGQAGGGIAPARRLDPFVDDRLLAIGQQCGRPLRDVQHTGLSRLRRQPCTPALHPVERAIQMVQIDAGPLGCFAAQLPGGEQDAFTHRGHVLERGFDHADAHRGQLVGGGVRRRDEGQLHVALQQVLQHEGPVRRLQGVVQRRSHPVHPRVGLRLVDGGGDASGRPQHDQHRRMRRPAVQDGHIGWQRGVERVPGTGRHHP